MTHRNHDQYRETRDLYWELLQAAQKQQDQQLVQLIRSQLVKGAASSSIQTGGCQMIDYPIPVHCTVDPEPESKFWKQNQFWQDCILCVCFVSSSLGCVLYCFVSLINKWCA
jgi:hypothetical protein